MAASAISSEAASLKLLEEAMICARRKCTKNMRGENRDFSSSDAFSQAASAWFVASK
jgi:hypothetical protein